jgi:hypothetical protein
MIYLDRFKFDPDATFGMLTFEGKELCFTLELPWNDNKTGESCIPEGVFNVSPHDSPKFPNTWQLENVPDRDAILIHVGNTRKDTHGCILVGSAMGRVGGLPAVLNSTATLKKLKEILPDKFTLTVEGKC